jgi:hypothetical protein
VTLNQEQVLNYLSKKTRIFKQSRLKKEKTFTCPKCKQFSASFKGDSDTITCLSCSSTLSLIDVVCLLENDFINKNSCEIAQYLKEKHKIDCKDVLLLDKVFDFYKRNNFDLVPLLRNNVKEKADMFVEKEWPKRIHKDILEWYTWTENNLNLAIKTGQASNITVIDFDKDVHEIFKNTTQVIQTTNKGKHYFYQYEADLKNAINISNTHIDILNNGKCAIAYPSVFNDKQRSWEMTDFNVLIPKMSVEVKNYLLKLTNKKSIEINEQKENKIDLNDLSDLDHIKEGGRNNALIKLGGVLRKELNSNQTQYVLNIFNKHFVKPSLPDREFYNLVKSIDNYCIFDDKDLAVKVLDYLRYAEEATSKDIEQALAEKKARIDKALAFLIKEQFVIRRGRLFCIVQKVEWRSDFPTLSTNINFNMPYFYDVAHFVWSDLLLLGFPPGEGKTTVSMNILRQLKDQNLTPHYICTEPASRFDRVAMSLGMKEGDIKWSLQSKAENIEIPGKEIVILDWLMIPDKAKTDVVLQRFTEMLFKKQSFLIIFMQLRKSNNEWLAKDLVEQYPSFAARYFYDGDKSGSTGYWQIDKNRESKVKNRRGIIPCQYDWETKRLSRIDEINFQKEAQKPVESKVEKIDEQGEVSF